MAYTSTHQLYASATSVGGDAIAQAIIPVSGRIVAVQMDIDAAAAAAHIRGEMSLQSTNQFTVNDARNILISIAIDAGNYGSNRVPMQIHCDVPVTEMDRVYIHYSGTSAFWRIVGLFWLRH